MDTHVQGHRKRLKERFKKGGLTGFHPYEILELLLMYTIPRKDVKPLAKSLISQFGGVSDVLDADSDDLESIHHIGQSTALFFQLIKQTIGVYHADKMHEKNLTSSPDLVLNFARAKLAGAPNEAFLVIYLDAQNRQIGFEILNKGTIDQVMVHPRAVIEGIIQNKASGVLFVHNHPSGEVSPSDEDIELTKTLINLCQSIQVRVLDHIIVGKGAFFSFLEKGLISPLLSQE